MPKRNFVVAGVLAMLMMLVVSSTPAAPAPKDKARYTGGPGVVPVASRSVPEPVGSTSGVTRVAIGGMAGGEYPGWRGAQITLAEDSGASGGIGVVLCYSTCSGADGFQKGFCTNAGGRIDLKKVPLKPGVQLSIRIGVVQPDGVFANVPGCDTPATTGTLLVTYCKNKKGKKFC